MMGTCLPIPPANYTYVVFSPEFVNTNSTTVSGFMKDNEANSTEDLFPPLKTVSQCPILKV